MSVYDEEIRENPLPYGVWGEAYVDSNSRAQMDAAMRLPISLAGALMPDAHVGYGLPIGGVLATEDAVIPYAVGVDIACRMRLSVFPVSPILLKQKEGQFKKALLEQTRFGSGAKWAKKEHAEHEVLDDPAWRESKFLGSLLNKAYEQLGTSGSGNHFVEWGGLTLEADDEELGLKAGEYLALVSHSGSRGVGYKIAEHFSAVAQKMHPNLNHSVSHLSWLPMEWHEGQAYWQAMELAGRFAAANHEVIHKRMAKAIGLKAAAGIENHHNFAGREQVTLPDGSITEAIVHRKGATPAGAGVMGIIPGSMADPGFLVRGKGNAASINSASHGAGRAMSRKAAESSITKTERDRYLKERGVVLIGAGIDESPQAYKQIDAIIAAQVDLIDIVGKFTPMMVRMDGTGSKAED